MTYKTYIDESGNTGHNLLDEMQEYYTLAAVSIPISEETHLLEKLRTEFESVREKDDKEIKAAKWIKAAKKSPVLRNILEEMKSVGCDFSVFFMEKRYMIATLIVNAFLDGYYNDIKDYTWCGNEEEMKKAAQYFYDALDDEDIRVIFPVFETPTLKGVESALKRVISKTTDMRYLKMLNGCHIQEVFEGEFNVMGDEAFKLNVLNSPNYTAFSTLGNMVVKTLLRPNGHRTEFIFDSCSFNRAYNHLYDILSNANDSAFAEKMFDFFSWKDHVSSFSVANSKDSLLQTADIVATSVLSSLKKVFHAEKLNSYDEFIVELVIDLYKNRKFNPVMNTELGHKLFRL
jgi:hypothetical protein